MIACTMIDAKPSDPGPESSAPWPITPLRDRYVTPYAGVTWELEPFEIGVKASALRTNTSLHGHEHVLVSPMPDHQGRPLFTRAEYVVVPLGADRPDALAQSPNGEAVFSTYELDDETPTVLQWLRRGDPVTVNATISRLGLDGDILGELRRVAGRRVGSDFAA